MQLYPIEAGMFKLDGGAMFGVVPKTIWTRTNPADANNLIDIAARCLLIEDGDRLILVDTGMGNKQSDKFFGYYSLWGDFELHKSLKEKGFSAAEVTDVFLTHLHFDHCGGAVNWNADRTGYECAFPNARYWTNKNHWDWATRPNAREKASFLKENILPLQESGQLHFLPLGDDAFIEDTPLGFSVLCVDGHTEKQMLPVIDYKGHRLVYTADLIATAGHIPLPYVMGYDTRPLQTLNEKAGFLQQATEENWLLFFEHDAHNQLCSLQMTEKGVRQDEIYSFSEIFDSQ